MIYLLDTNTLIARLNGNSKISERLQRLSSNEIILCAPVLAELIYGARSSSRVADNLARIENLKERMRVEPFDTAAAEVFASVKADLRRRGISKADFDLAIASIAMSRRATLVSNDHAFHDGTIASLVAENWLRAK